MGESTMIETKGSLLTRVVDEDVGVDSGGIVGSG